MKFKPSFKFRFSVGLLVGSLGALALAVVVFTHGALYLLTWRSASVANEQSARRAAENTGLGVTNLIKLLNQSLAVQAGDAKLAHALVRADPALVRQEEERLTHAIPYAWLVRLLPENADFPDESRAPHMGFADLDIVKDSLVEASAQPTFALANSPNAHLAMARRLEGGGGVIHASWPAKLFDAVVASDGACGVELRQDNITLAYRGEPGCKAGEPLGEQDVAGTSWKIFYWAKPEVEANAMWFAIALGGSAALIAGFTALLFYLLKTSWRHDCQSLLTQIDDLQSGNPLLNYPMKLAELNALSEEIFRIKRVAREVVAAMPELSPPMPLAVNLSEPLSEMSSLDKRQNFERKRKPEPEPEPEPSHVDLDVGQLGSTGIFRSCDIRGLVGSEITTDVMYALGLAIGSEMEAQGEKYVAIGRDGRLSSADLFKPLAQGLLDTGRMVINLGQAPTPLVYYATHTLSSHSAVMLTASNNPPNHNGLKIVIGGEALAEGRIQALRKRIENSRFVSGSGRMENYNLVPEYIERVIGDTQLGRDMKVVIDCGNGVAGLVAPGLLRAMGCEVVELFCEVDGRFPNHLPDPSDPDNLKALIDKVLQTGAELGVAFDGDGDRLGLVDSNGKIVWPDRLMMLFAADVLSREPGADIIYDARCSRHLPSQIVKNGGRPSLCKSGHALIKKKMKESGAMLGGEFSGHIYFQERWYGFDDGLYACARLVEILSVHDEPSGEVFAKYPISVISTPELRSHLEEGNNFEIIEQFRSLANFADSRNTDIDGLRVDFLDGWGVVRASSSMPTLNFRFEADSEKSLNHIQRQFAKLLLAIKPDIELPFEVEPDSEENGA